MQAFDVPNLTPDEFMAAIHRELAARDYDRYLDLELDGDRLVVELRWMGTTRFNYRLNPTGEGFRAELVSRKVSPFHAAFASRFDEYFERALSKVGAVSV